MELPISLRLSIRNVFRNRIRSFITLSAIAFGAISLIIAGGFFEDSFMQMREAYIHSYLGHIQVHKKGFSDKGSAKPFEYLIDEPNKIITLISSLDHVKIATPRISFSGLLSDGENTISVLCQGIAPKGEKALNIIDETKNENRGLGIQAGENLSEKDEFDLILGKGLSKAVESSIDNSLVLLSNTVDGALNAFDLNVKGIFFTASKEFDDRTIRVPISTAQKLLRTDKVQTLVVVLDKTKYTTQVKNNLLRLLKDNKIGLEVRTWDEMADFYNKTVELYGRQFFFLKLIISIIVVLSIFNTINMAIWERTREIGTIMALGFNRFDILKTFLLEGFILGTIGGIIGIIGGIIMAYLISIIGIPMPPPPGATVNWIAMIKIVPEILISAFIISTLSSLISSFYPAFKASRMVIADALRHI
ncbi:MAG: ABC transporter permease [Desulfobacterales bacterium]|nr:ABC transporter permease [Desulfobacterales bacterium]